MNDRVDPGREAAPSILPGWSNDMSKTEAAGMQLPYSAPPLKIRGARGVMKERHCRAEQRRSIEGGKSK